MAEFLASLDPKAAEQVEYLLENVPFAVWETLYSTVLATFFAYLVGLPLGVILVVGEERGVLPLPRPLMSALNVAVNLLRSVPFLILMVVVFPLSRVILGTSIGTKASIVPLFIASFPFVARLVEAPLREMDRGIIEAAQAMGSSPFQIIRKVILPESLPSLLTGFATAFVTILSYGAMSGAIGGGGLGAMALNRGYTRHQNIVLWTAVVLLVILVQIFQTVGTGLAVRTDRRLSKSGRGRKRKALKKKVDTEKRFPPGAM